MLRTHSASRRKASQFHVKSPRPTTRPSAFSINRLSGAPTYAGIAPPSTSPSASTRAPPPEPTTASRVAAAPASGLTKRRPGRPCSSRNKSKTWTKSAPPTQAAPIPVVPVKRGPGRPCKHPVPTLPTTQFNSIIALKPEKVTSNPITSESNMSYASSLASTHQIFREGSLSPPTSDSERDELSDDEEDQLDATDKSVTPSSRTRKDKGRARADIYTQATASSFTLSPSRKSARIGDSGFSMERASARRDELDDLLLGKTPSPAANRVRQSVQEPAPAAVVPVIAAPQPASLLQGVPIKRGRGRPRKHPLVVPQQASVQSTPSAATAGWSKVEARTPFARINNLPTSQRRRLPLPAQAPGMESVDDLSNPPEEDENEWQEEEDDNEVLEAKPPAKRARRMSQPVLASAPVIAPEPVVKRGRGRPPGSGKKKNALLSAGTAISSPASRSLNISLRPRNSLASLPAARKEKDEPRSPMLTRRTRLSRSIGEAGPSSSPATASSNKPFAALSATQTPTPSTPTSPTPGPGETEDESQQSILLSSQQQQDQRMAKPAWKKKIFHNAGLYSNSSSAPSSSDAGSKSRGKRPEVTDLTFPQPINLGVTLLTEERDFRLPYPVYDEADEVRARVNAKKKPPPYNHIKSNKYYSRPKLHGEVPLCHCEPSSNCGDQCMNRILQYICDPKTCPCGDRCTNISFGKRPGVRTDVAYYGGRGFGLKTLEAIPKHGFIDEYRGEVINLTEATKRTNEAYKFTGNFYFLDYDAAAGEILDGGRRGNITRYANHSCDPNCYIEKWIVCGTDEARTAEFQIGLFALRDIEAGEELMYNYGWSAFQPKTITGAAAAEVAPQACLCGAPNCAGILGAKKNPPTKPAAVVAKKHGRPKAMAAKLKTGASRLQKAGALEGARKPDEAAVELANKVIAKRAERFTRMQAEEAAETTPARQQARVENWRLFTNVPPPGLLLEQPLPPETPTQVEQEAEETVPETESSAYSTASPSPSSAMSTLPEGEAPRTPARSQRRRISAPLTPEEVDQLAAHRRARNAFLARVRRASKRGIIIEDPTQHPLKKQSIQCTSAPENTYIPDLPSSLSQLGMTTAEARKARNAFLARVRRGMKRGLSKEESISVAAKPLPEDESLDTPVMRAQRLKEAGGSEASFEGTSIM